MCFECVIIDLVLDYDFKLGWMLMVSVDWVIVFVCECVLCVEWIFEMYVYVDYFFVVFYFKCYLGGCIGIG